MRSLISLLAISLFAACLQSPNEAQTQQDVMTHNRLAANRLAANRLAANRLAANRLAANHLSDGTFALNSETAEELLATSDGREVLTYIISCALPSTVILTAPDGTQFAGAIGVAPRWQDHPLDADGQAWESACLFARVNANDVAVPISIRGSNPALATTATEVADWTIQEGAFYGQYFTDTSQSVEWIACQGTDVAGAVAAERDCAAPDPANPGYTLCGFYDAGPCHSDTHHHWFDDPAACLFYIDQDYYAGCFVPRPARPDFQHASNGVGNDGGYHGWDDGRDPGFFLEVITTYVHP